VSVLILVTGLGLGWLINGWRLSGEIQRLKKVESDNATLTSAINVQNARILELEHEGNAKKAQAEKAVKIATEANKKLESQLTLLRNATGKTCEDADALIDQVLLK